jgi:hypothetical protein
MSFMRKIFTCWRDISEYEVLFQVNGPLAWGLDMELITPDLKISACYQMPQMALYMNRLFE